MSNFIQFSIVISLLPVLLGTASRGQEVSADGFRWLDEQRDGAVWNNVRTALGDELKPDPSDPNTFTYGYKYVERIGIYEHSALVIVGHRQKEEEPPGRRGDEYFFAFNYDLKSGLLTKIDNPEHPDGNGLYMYHWKFVGIPRFGDSAAPDVTFTYDNCWECEEERILGSFQYDSTKSSWQVRDFGNGDLKWWMTRVGVVVDKDVAFVPEIVSFRCLYGLTDADPEGLGALAVRCRQVDRETSKKVSITDTTILFSGRGGKFSGKAVTTKDEKTKIWSCLCKGSTSDRMCKGVDPR